MHFVLYLQLRGHPMEQLFILHRLQLLEIHQQSTDVQRQIKNGILIVILDVQI